MPKAVIAYPIEIWSAGLAALLREQGWEVAGCCMEAQQAIDRLGRSRADLLVIAKGLITRDFLENLRRPDGTGFVGRVILVLEEGARLSVHEFVTLEVEGLLLSSASKAQLAECLADVERGRSWIDPNVRAVLGQSERHLPYLGELTSRELSVARLAVTGQSNKVIAKALKVSDGTVKMHMHHILAKLHVPSRFELIRLFGDALNGAGTADGTLPALAATYRSENEIAGERPLLAVNR